MLKYLNNIVFILLLIISCSYRTPSPEWLNQQPVSSDFWYGIASVGKNTEDYRQKAMELATDQIAFQIRTHIQSTRQLTREEINLKFSEQYKSIIESRTDIVLDDIETVETFISRDKYHVFIQLNKNIYFEKIEIKKNKAINIAVDFMTSAEKNFSIESFNYIIKALNEITPFLDYSLVTEYPIGSGEMVNLNSEIFIMADRLKSRLALNIDNQEINTVLGKKQNYSIQLESIDKKTNSIISNIPLEASMRGNKISDSMVTDNNGKTKFHLFKISNKDPVQYVEISISLPEFLEKFQFESIHDVTIKVNVSPVNIYLKFDENNLNNSLSNPFLVPDFKTFLLQTYGAKFTNIKSKSDLYILAKINTTAKMENQNEYGLFQVYADCTISFYDTVTDNELYQTSINNVMGVDFNSLDGAGRNALKNLVKEVKSDTFQEIVVELGEYLSQIK